MRTLYIAIGPSGSGKSTVYNTLREKYPELVHYSWDSLRHSWYDVDNYRNAWNLANADPTFYNRAFEVYKSFLDANVDIYIDNTNLTKKGRKRFVKLAKELGYRTIGIVFDSIGLDELISRQSTRPDKYVPASAVIRQYNSFQPPTVSEFDEVFNSVDIRAI